MNSSKLPKNLDKLNPDHTGFLLARRNLLGFAEWMHPGYRVNWHHQVIAEALTRVARGLCKRLMILLPPRHGKSELASALFPPFCLGINPNIKFISTSYGQDLASYFNTAVQRYIDNPRYRLLFPNTVLGRSMDENGKVLKMGDAIRNTKQFEIVGSSGGYVCAGIGGAITGKGGKILVIDDPTKNYEDALSPTHRKKNFDWYGTTFLSRQEPDSAVVIIQTVWHEDDLAMKVLKAEPHFEVIRIPAILEEHHLKTKHPMDPRQVGDALWPDQYDLNFLLGIKPVIGSKNFSALYQQDPKPAEGSIIKKDWIKFYDKPEERYDEIIQSWDMAFAKTDDSSFVVGSIYGKKGSTVDLLDQVRDRMNFPETVEAFKRLTSAWPGAYRKVVEKKANGQAVIDSLTMLIPGIIGASPAESKESRVNAVSPFYEAGNVRYPKPESVNWILGHIEEITDFPSGSNDDRVDAESQALITLLGDPVGNWTDELDSKRLEVVSQKW